MERKYTENDIMLILNYDTNEKQILNLEERCLFHQYANELYFGRRSTISDKMRGKAAAILTEINHKNYKYVRKHYMFDNEKDQLSLIKPF